MREHEYSRSIENRAAIAIGVDRLWDWVALQSMFVFIIERVDFDPRRDFLSSTSAGPDRRSFAARRSASTPAAQ